MFSGHSMRAGYATSAAAKDMPGYRIRKHTRHKSPAVLEATSAQPSSGPRVVLRGWASSPREVAADRCTLAFLKAKQVGGYLHLGSIRLHPLDEVSK